MSSKGSLNFQMKNRMEALKAMGDSRRERKIDYKQNIQNKNEDGHGKTLGIHSFNTYKKYEDVSKQFIKYVKQEYTDVKDINNITAEMATKYLQQCQSKGDSPYTCSTKMTAINKLFNMKLTKEKLVLEKRNSHEIKRSRGTAQPRRYNPDNYKGQIQIAKSFGLRRASIALEKVNDKKHYNPYPVKDISLFKYNDKVYISVIEKGGKYREVECLKERQNEILKAYPNIQERQPMNEWQFKEFYKNNGEVLFQKYSGKIDNHSFRREYAQNLYKQKLKEKEDKIRKEIEKDLLIKGYQFNKDLIEEQLKMRMELEQKYCEFDREVLTEVSRALGHERVDTAVGNYLRD